MGKMEFYLWVDQACREQEAERRGQETWAGSRDDPAWQAMRQKRDQEMGRR